MLFFLRTTSSSGIDRFIKFIILSLILLSYLSILLFFFSTNSISSHAHNSFTCETWKNSSYINNAKYEICLKWNRNDAFWRVQGIRHTAFKNLLNSSSLIVEVGGNIGQDTSQFIELYNSSIITFEPLVPMAKDLIEKFKTNPKIEIQPYGLGNRETSIFRKLSSTNSSRIQLLEVTQVIENIRRTKTKDGMIDMISMNCEGCEFEIIPALIVNNLTQYFRIIQFATHIDVLKNSSCIYCQIEQSLERTHQTIYRYSMLWEAWVLKNKIEN